MALFIVYAVENADATTCRLTYTDNATISETQMQTWAKDAKWPLPVPKYDRDKKYCVCSSEVKDPTELSLDDYVPVWIAPADLRSLKTNNYVSNLPDGIPDVQGTYDHVKVCLKHQNLIDLWGTKWLGTHCHQPNVSDGRQTDLVERFFLGYDGALYCSPPKTSKIWCECSANKMHYINSKNPGFTRNGPAPTVSEYDDQTSKNVGWTQSSTCSSVLNLKTTTYSDSRYAEYLQIDVNYGCLNEPYNTLETTQDAEALDYFSL